MQIIHIRKEIKDVTIGSIDIKIIREYYENSTHKFNNSKQINSLKGKAIQFIQGKIESE